MEQLYLGIDVDIIGYPMPRKIKGFVNKDNGKYIIVVNNQISQEQQIKALEHEINHLVNDHFYAEDIEDIERRCDQ